MLDSLLTKSDVLLQIIGINLVLSGDNALIIALATRRLPKPQQRLGMIIGVSGALLMRIALSFGLWRLLEIPGLHLLGGIALLFIAIQLSVPQTKPSPLEETSLKLGMAIRQIMIADAMMSADNVLAVAAASRGDFTLMALGIVLCVPLIVLGSDVLTRLIERWSFILVLGSGLLGWVAGELLNEDQVLDTLGISAALQDSLAPILGTVVFIIAFRRWYSSKTV